MMLLLETMCEGHPWPKPSLRAFSNVNIIWALKMFSGPLHYLIVCCVICQYYAICCYVLPCYVILPKKRYSTGCQQDLREVVYCSLAQPSTSLLLGNKTACYCNSYCDTTTATTTVASMSWLRRRMPYSHSHLRVTGREVILPGRVGSRCRIMSHWLSCCTCPRPVGFSLR